MGMLRKVGTYTVTVKYTATADNDWAELAAKIEKLVGVHAVVLEKVEDVEKHCRGEWNNVNAAI